MFQVIAENLQKVDPKSDGAKRDWVAIYDECASVLYEVCSSAFITLRIQSLWVESKFLKFSIFIRNFFST